MNITIPGDDAFIFLAVIMYFSQASNESRKSSLGSWERGQMNGGAERGF